jgi:dihydropteroate synthase
MVSGTRYMNVKGTLIDFSVPKVMGIINVSPESFYKGSSFLVEEEMIAATDSMIEEGADFIDVGGYSSRPGAETISYEEERKRVIKAVKLITREFPKAVISVDTFRSEIAAEAVLDHGASLINDISGGEADLKMFSIVEKLKVPYILMHMQGKPATMQADPKYDDVVADIIKWLGERVVKLQALGVSDIIIDPGFGFGKTISQNYQLLKDLNDFSVIGLPLLVGISRKSMIWKPLGIAPDEALNGTSVLNAVALMKGADILRVHDVKEAVQAVKLLEELKQ